MFDFGDIVDKKIARRREVVFIILAGFFLGTLAILNILGLSRQIDLSFTIGGTTIPFIVFIGVLPYPITFLCTDFISELYGRRRANIVVWVGLALNIWVLFILWVGGVLPPQVELLENGLPALDDSNHTFFQIRKWTFGATAASMIAYMTAQFVDVHLFHSIRRLTKGKMLWLRNNGSTLTSQMIDSIAVVTITFFYAPSAITLTAGGTVFHGLLILILSNYVFKMVSALLDTLPFYIGTSMLAKYLHLDPNKEFLEEESANPE
ncbi:MAG: queuosine precursor transporter [Bacteroidales bacterium]|nr:queuosine precursor transporter [Bacteroidales bacterium]MCF8390230.1 queuosine precursor transporter [Bacteroidales bacterium]